MAHLIREWVMSYEQWIRESWFDSSPTHPPLKNNNEQITAPEDAMQVDLVPELPPSGGFENIVTAMDIIFRYVFACPTSYQDAKTIAKIIINIMTIHAYQPTTFISGKGSAFVSQVTKEVAGSPGITQKHVTTKTPNRLGCLNDCKRQSNKLRRLKPVNTDHCGIYTSALSFKIIKLLIKQVLAVRQAWCSMDALLILS